MPEVATELKTFRFDQMAVQVKDKVHPDNADVDRYVGLEHIDPESLKIRRWGEPGDVASTKILFRPGDIIFGKRRAYQRKLAVADFDGICSAHAMVLRPKTEVVLKEFLPFFMQTDTFMERAVKISVGGLSPTINWKDLAKEEFALPPIEEQQQVVQVLRAADRLAESFLSIASAAEEILTSLSKKYFQLSQWPEHRFDEHLVHSSDGPFGSKIKTEHYATHGARVIRLNNIDKNRFIDDDKAFLAMDYFDSMLRSYEVHAGDIVVAGLGDDSIEAGRACVIPNGLGPALNKADCFCLRPTSDLCPAYLAFFLNSPAGLAQSASFSQGTTRMRLNLGNIKRMKVPIPPYEDQEKIVHELSAVLRGVESARSRHASVVTQRGVLLNQLLKRIT